jgi:hypothetical protein
MLVPAGSTTHFNVLYDDSLSYAEALAGDVLDRADHVAARAPLLQ